MLTRRTALKGVAGGAVALATSVAIPAVAGTNADAEIFAAERELDALAPFADDTEENTALYVRLHCRIRDAKPTTREGALAKLRRLADPETGIEAGYDPEDGPALRECLAILAGGTS